MKSLLFFFLFILSTLFSIAQKPEKPILKPGELPTPRIQALTKPDLQVTQLEFISASRNPSTRVLTIKVRVTIRNNGQLKAITNTLKSCFRKNEQENWVDVGTILKQNELMGGQQTTAEYSFSYGKTGMDNLRQLYFCVRTDALNSVAESDERNNYSNGILIGL